MVAPLRPSSMQAPAGSRQHGGASRLPASTPGPAAVRPCQLHVADGAMRARGQPCAVAGRSSSSSSTSTSSSSNHALAREPLAAGSVLEWARQGDQQQSGNTWASSTSTSTSTSSSLSAHAADGVMLQLLPSQQGSHSRSSSSSSSSSSSNGGSNHAATTDSAQADKRLMQAITQQCGHDVQQLGALVAARSADFKACHCAAALYTLAASWQQQQQELQQAAHAGQAQLLVLRRAELRGVYLQHVQLADALLGGLQQQVAAAALRDVADALFAVDKLGMHAASEQQHERAGGQRARACVAALLQQAAVLLRVQDGVTLQQLSRVLCSCCGIGLRASEEWWAAALEAAAALLEQRQHEQHQQQSLDAADRRRDAQAVALLGWAVARLRAPASAAWWGCFQAAARPLLADMSGSQLANVLWALATARQAPGAGTMAAFFAASQPRLPQLSPQGLSNIVWALAVLQQPPPAAWLQEAHACAAASMQAFSLQHIAMMCWGTGKLRWYAAALAGTTHSTSSSKSSSSMQQHPPWLDQALVQLSSSVLPGTAGASQSVACVLWGLVRLQVQVPQERLQQLQEVAVDMLSEPSPQAAATIIWAVGRLGGSHVSRGVPKRLRRLARAHPSLLQDTTPQGLCMLLHGLSSMQAWQPPDFKQQLLDAVAAKLPAAQHAHQQSQVQPQRVGQSAGRHARQQRRAQQQPDSSGVPRQRARFESGSLPFVLVWLKQLRVPVPTELLHAVEQHLGQPQQLACLSTQQLSLLLLVLGSARHTPQPAFLRAALRQLSAQLGRCGSRDVAHALYGLASMVCWSGSTRELLAAEQGRLSTLLQRAEQVMHGMDHASLAMFMWALPRLQLRPSEGLMQAVLAATLRQLPAASLLSVTSILAALQALKYLPPLAWMVDVCGAARAKVNADVSPTAWQRRDCVRRFEAAVVWYNEAAAAAAAGTDASSASASSSGSSMHSASASPTSSVDDGDVAGSKQQQLVHQQRQQARMRMLSAAKESSDSLLAAAVGVAAAVAQHWHP